VALIAEYLCGQAVNALISVNEESSGAPNEAQGDVLYDGCAHWSGSFVRRSLSSGLCRGCAGIGSNCPLSAVDNGRPAAREFLTNRLLKLDFCNQRLESTLSDLLYHFRFSSASTALNVD
jgi:hypothetical protein